MEEEIWLPIKGYEGRYEVSHFGRVKSLLKCRGKEGCVLVQNDIGGRVNVNLHCDKRQKTFYVHTLVLKNFNCEMPHGMECCHNDGDYKNNYIGNLRWDTRSGNVQDAIKHGTFTTGAKNGNAKLDNKEVAVIKELVFNGMLHKEVAKKYNVSMTCISNIKRQITYR